MQFTKLSLMAVAVSGALAQPQPTAALAARQDLSKCSSAFVTKGTFFSEMPVPTGDAASVIAKVTATDECEIPAVTGDRASAYSSYMSQASSWYQKHQSEYAEIVTECGKDFSAALTSAGYSNVLAATACTSMKWGASETAVSTNGAISRQVGSTLVVVGLAALTAVGLL
ncbi:unnamed protein product [Clonostachys rosea f. rosea IK726]|jgi:hypothetical protein|uniref:Uncharacterized protein n=1 Tax=Clonostachys rosea f. rosea IK726 TaxID=1349383 RepID=A0ACA9UTD6_BIOOC|nr:unnamed protein product [Clonostachys rosea f. rosea IK726]